MYVRLVCPHSDSAYFIVDEIEHVILHSIGVSHMFSGQLFELSLRRQKQAGSYEPAHVRLCVEALEGRVLLSAAAAFLSKSVPDHRVVPLNASFDQYFVLKNTGTTTWSGYTLVFVNGSDRLGSPLSVAIPTTAPNGTATVKVPLQAVRTVANSSGAAQLAFWEIKNGSAVVPISGTTYNVHVSPVSPKDKIWTAITVDSPTTGPGMPRLDSTGYTSTINPYVDIGNGGQCTAYVWGRVYEMNFGIQLAVNTAAGQSWIDKLKAKYKVDQIASRNSIAVWSNGSGGGHVAYVENVSGSNVSISEANWNSYTGFAGVNDPMNKDGYPKPWWGGGYDGGWKVLTTSQMNSRGSYTLLGYIHLS